MVIIMFDSLKFQSTRELGTLASKGRGRRRKINMSTYGY